MTLSQMRNLASDWSIEGAAAPNDIAIQNANKVIELLSRPVDYMQPSVEEGVSIHFKNGNFGAFVECYNDGEIGYTLTHYGKSVSSKDLRAESIASLDFFREIQLHLGAREEQRQLG